MEQSLLLAFNEMNTDNNSSEAGDYSYFKDFDVLALAKCRVRKVLDYHLESDHCMRCAAPLPSAFGAESKFDFMVTLGRTYNGTGQFCTDLCVVCGGARRPRTEYPRHCSYTCVLEEKLGALVSCFPKLDDPALIACAKKMIEESKEKKVVYTDSSFCPGDCRDKQDRGMLIIAFEELRMTRHDEIRATHEKDMTYEQLFELLKNDEMYQKLLKLKFSPLVSVC